MVIEPGPKTGVAFDGDYKRNTIKRDSSESSSSSDSSGAEAEADKLQQELEKLIRKHKELDMKANAK